MLHSEFYCCLLVDHGLNRRKCSELMSRSVGGSQRKTGFLGPAKTKSDAALLRHLTVTSVMTYRQLRQGK